MYFKVINLEKTFIFQPKNKLDTYYGDMGETLAHIINDFESYHDITIFDTNRHQILNNYTKYYHSVFYYRFEKILWLYRYWNKHKSWKSPIVAKPVGTGFKIHPGRDRWLVMKSAKAEFYNFLVVDHIGENTLDQIKPFWDHGTLSIKDEGERTHFYHDYDKSEVLQLTTIKQWISSRLPLIDFLHK